MENKVKAQIIVLPTKNETQIWQYDSGQHIHTFVEYSKDHAITHVKKGDWCLCAGDTDWRGPDRNHYTLLRYTGNELGVNKIIATTDPYLNLPLIPKDFLQKYVTANGGIKEVYIEIEEVWEGFTFTNYESIFCGYAIKTTKDNTCIISEQI